jgi:hypothetical protein
MQATKLFAVIALLFGLSIAGPVIFTEGQIHPSKFAIFVLRVPLTFNRSPGLPNSSSSATVKKLGV